jgi:hypothetical protein
VWSELVHDQPDYAPARTNLALLGSKNEVVLGQTAAVVPSPAAAVKAIEDQRKVPTQMHETELVMAPQNKVEGE